MNPLIPITLGVYLILCACLDVLLRRIPNRLTYPAMLVALAAHAATGGTPAFLHSLGGLGAGMAMLMPFYLVKGMGAGDVKLMGVVGACLGPGRTLHAFVWTAFAGGLYAVILLAIHPHQLVIFLKTCFSKCLGVARAFRRGMDAARIPPLSQEEMTQEARPLKVCYGVAIALGTIGYMLWEHVGYSGWSELITALSGKL